MRGGIQLMHSTEQCGGGRSVVSRQGRGGGGRGEGGRGREGGREAGRKGERVGRGRVDMVIEIKYMYPSRCKLFAH